MAQALDTTGHVSRTLRSFIDNHGPAVLSNPSTLIALLQDGLSGYTAEIQTLAVLGSAGLPQVLAQQVDDSGQLPDGAAEHLAAEFSERTSINHDFCLWAVQQFADALGYSFRTQHDTSGHSPEAPGVRVFISYRRSDSSGYVGRLNRDLVEVFGTQAVFMDLASIDLGADFVAALNDSLTRCDALLAVIGRRWMSAVDEAGSARISDEHDFVRIEIEVALAKGIHIFPILVEGATMPSAESLPESLAPLIRRQALEISDRHWDRSVEDLVSTLRALAQARSEPTNQ